MIVDFNKANDWVAFAQSRYVGLNLIQSEKTYSIYTVLHLVSLSLQCSLT